MMELVFLAIGIIFLQSDFVPEICSELEGSLLVNCNFGEDFLGAAILPWEYVSGGFFTPIFWGVIVGGVYLKYKNGVMAVLVGLPVLMGGAVLLPSGAEIAIPLFIASVIAVSIYYLVYRSPGVGRE